MSFLNPTAESVLRFSSTDAGAPQIDYNSRSAGDVKAVIKACLVTGYGDKESAGWSITNEVGHVAEFISPSVPMSDYRIGIDDTSTSSTTWYYTHQGSRQNPNYNTPSKSISYIDKTNPSNGWQLIVSDRGLYFVEIMMHSGELQLVSRVMWIGQIKSGIKAVSGVNMSYFSTGQGSQMTYPALLTTSSVTNHKTYNLGSFTSLNFNVSNFLAFDKNNVTRDESVIDITSDIYLSSPLSANIVGQQSSALLKVVSSDSDALGVVDEVLEGRPVLSASVVRNGATSVIATAKKILIRLDYWEY